MLGVLFCRYRSGTVEERAIFTNEAKEYAVDRSPILSQCVRCIPVLGSGSNNFEVLRSAAREVDNFPVCDFGEDDSLSHPPERWSEICSFKERERSEARELFVDLSCVEARQKL